jgi:NAD(P)-dependent dehydrogenase (short-subunit alcohol dehydrogenase family)
MREQTLPSGVAVVTGAAGGMGSAMARQLAEAGWSQLLLCDIEASRIETVAAPLRASGAKVEILAGDVSDPGFPGQVVAALKDRPIAALIHAAGISHSMGSIERILDVNLGATQRLVDAIRDRMAEGAAAVLVASNSAYFPMPPEAEAAVAQPLPPEGAKAIAHLVPAPVVAYPLSKKGVIALVKREAKSFGRRGARLVSISPGATDTNMSRFEMSQGDSSSASAFIENAALPRIADPGELAAVAVFLCSPAASFVTACDVLVDGGEVACAGL